MINVRNGHTVSENGTNMTKPLLLTTIRAFIRLEQNAPSLVQAYDKDTTSSGTYLKDLDMSNSTKIDRHFQQILETNFINRDENRALKMEFEVAHDMWKNNKFVHNFELIVMEIPEL